MSTSKVNHDIGSKSIVEMRKHPIYWFDDGTLTLEVHDVQFRVHYSLFQRHSSFLASAKPEISTYKSSSNDSCTHKCVFCGADQGFRPSDVEALLEHMYHDIPLSSDSSFERIVAVLRSTGPQQFDMPIVHAHSKKILVSYFDSKDVSVIEQNDLFTAVAVARTFRILSILKPALYYSMITANLDLGDDTLLDPQAQSQSAALSDPSPSVVTRNGYQLADSDVKLCKSLMTRVIDHFTPILFTPATTPHIACTDVFADNWMTLVISPAIETSGVYKPIETLERIRGLDWSKHGLCSACVAEKREEWREEQETVWTMIETWLEREV